MKVLLAIALLTASTAASAQSNSSCCRQEALDYRAAMMPVQRALNLAFLAGICRLRSERYFEVMSTSAQLYAMQQAQKFGITNEEMTSADADAKEILSAEAANARKSHELMCHDLARDPRLDRLDDVERQITSNFH
ncbi:hypothetical protein [Bradyrhizobium neotropicale]|nr:hypothetical protein [Bradyrhizobium neotropicale]